MPGEIEVLIDDQKVESIRLPEVEIPVDLDGYSYGEPQKMVVKNAGDTRLRGIELSLEGEGSKNVVLSSSLKGFITASSRFVFDKSLGPGETHEVWAAGRYQRADDEHSKDFVIVVRAESLG